MNIGGINFFGGEKAKRVQDQLYEIKKIFDTNSNNNFNIIQNYTNKEELDNYNCFVNCGDIKITFNRELIKRYLDIKSTKKPILIRDVTYLRVIPKLRKLDVNHFPRFTWNSILPYKNNFPYDKSYNRWDDIKKKYNLTIKEYKKQRDNILFFLQIPTDASLNDLNFKKDGYLNFMIRTINDIFNYSDRKIILRSHPLNRKNDLIAEFLVNHFRKTNKVFLSNENLLEDEFKNIKCAISYNSSASIEALFNGINVINLSKMQPGFSAASNNLADIEKLSELNRDEFLKKIAFLHWENNEFESEENKKYLCKLFEISMQQEIDDNFS